MSRIVKLCAFLIQNADKTVFLSIAGGSSLIYDEGVMRAQHPAFL